MKQQKKQNTQMEQPFDSIKALQSLNLMDDFLFDVITEDLEVCKIILELCLGFKIRSIRWKETQKVFHNLPGKRGIRMDFYVEDETGKIYNVEMQKRNERNIPKRTRFYQALLDAPLLESGEKGFDALNPTYIIIICGFDLFGAGKYRYTFVNTCVEKPSLWLGDECTKIILNTKGINDSEVAPELVHFLHYVELSTEDRLSEGCDERLLHLHKKIKQIKSNAEMGVTYMKMEERDRLLREEGLTKGREEGLTAGREQGIAALIASCQELGASEANTRKHLITGFSLSPEKAEEYLKEYWQTDH